MARNLLTMMQIKNASKRKLRDGDGLWLHTGKSGNRFWVFIFVRNGRRREMGLGAYGSGTGQVGLAAARVKAEEIRAILGRGGDPFKEMEERKAVIKPVTFGKAADDYIDAMKSKWRGAKTEATWRNTLTVHAKPIRKLPLAEITTDDVVRCLRPIWETKPETAAKTRERIKLVLDNAKARGLREGDNPAEWKGHLDQILAPPQKLTRGHHAAMAAADIPALIARLHKSSGFAAKALEFTILTAARPGEARGAVWSEIDLEAALWIIPGDRMKGGREHRVPLSAAAMVVVREMAEKRISDFVFPGGKAKAPLSDMSVTKALATAGGGDYTVHGFRSSFRDWASDETNHSREITEAALAHVVGDKTERSYRRSDALAKRRKLMEDWAIYCNSARA